MSIIAKKACFMVDSLKLSYKVFAIKNFEIVIRHIVMGLE